MRKILIGLIVFFSVLSSVFSFSEKDIISPIGGTWNNLQPIVLNVEEGTEIYYSLTGIDPLRFGFAYDGPVVLEQKGDVSLRITSVDSNGKRQDFTIDYTVKDCNLAGNGKTTAFINDIISHPIKRYISGSVFSIPETFNYTIDENANFTFTGSDLHLSEANNVERYIPFTVTDGSNYFHFVLNVIPAKISSQKSKNLPFTIENWNIVCFSSSKFLYSIDGGMWSRELSACVLDRLIPHTISWKLAEENSELKDKEEIFSYRLPPMPQIVSTLETHGQMTFSLIPAPNDIDNTFSYKLGKVPQNLSIIGISDGLYDTVTIDAFYGEELSSEFSVGVYYDGVYQGSLKSSVLVDRMPPDPPVITSYSQNETVLVAEAEKDAEVYYSISEPLEFDAEEILSMENQFSDLRTGEFKKFVKGREKLSSISDKATFYKIQAYAIDRAGNKSETTEYRFVVDEHNFYLNPLAINSEKRDGSYINPFATLEEAVLAMNEMSQMRLHIIGNITVNETVEIKKDCDIIGKNNNILFMENACFSVRNASVSVKKCSFSKKTTDINDKNFIHVSEGAIIFDDSQLSASYVSDGTLVESNMASLKFDNTALTVYSSSYACNVRAMESSITASNARFNAIAHTSVNLSIVSSNCAMYDAVTYISGHIGRTMECIKSSILLEKNIFKASLDATIKKQDIEAVWKDADTVDCSKENNIMYGF